MRSSKTMTSAQKADARLSVWAIYARLLRMARPSRRAVAAIGALTLLNALLAAALPWPLQYLVDHVFGTAPPIPLVARSLAACGVSTREGAVAALALVALLIHLLSGLADVLRTRLEVGAGQGSIYELRSRLFDHYQRLSLQHHRAMPLGDQLYRLNNDTACIDQLVLAGLLPLVGSAVTLLAMLVVLWRLDASLAILSLAVVPFLAACVRFYMGPLERQAQHVSEHEAEVLSAAERVLGALPLVKAFTREGFEAHRFREQGRGALRARLRLTSQEAWFGFAARLVTAGGTSLILAVGGLHVVAGRLSVGQLLVVVAYLAAVYDPLHVISYTLGQMQTALAGARRVLEVLDTDIEPREDSAHSQILPRGQGHVVFEQVSFGYQTGARVLQEVSFEMTPGSLTAVVGPTGAGKTTLTSLLLRFYAPDAGRILVDDCDIGQVSVASLRRHISIVPQEAVLFPVSIAENIRYGKPDASDEEVFEAARAARADEFIRALPDGYDTLVAEGSTSLSGGERQRLALARAFLKDAPILILDEPTSSLDAATESLILESLEQLTSQRTTLVIAHRLSTIRRADHILFLQNGRIVERGTHRELLRDAGSYARLHQLYVKTVGVES